MTLNLESDSRTLDKYGELELLYSFADEGLL